jgi:hypothetical protein
MVLHNGAFHAVASSELTSIHCLNLPLRKAGGVDVSLDVTGG